jgi:T4 RnlA family RNA ligase
MIKMDGSLISTFNHKNTCRLKSKGSIQSTQVVESARFLQSKPDLLELLTYLTVSKDYTVNMEYCSPTNRIVIGYLEPSLTILNVRNNKNGDYIYWDAIIDDLTTQNKKHLIYPLSKNWVEVIIPPQTDHNSIYETFVMTEKEGIEGYVIQLNNGQCCKQKMQKYLHLHRNKDNISNPRKLFEAVLDEVTDDLRSLFHDDPLSLKIISEMEELVESIYNPLVDRLEKFYAANKHLERKEYAILGQQTFDREFGLAMNMYLKKDVKIKDFLKKNFKNYGVKEIETIEE